MPDLKETYGHRDKKPFGSYVAFHLLEEMFYRNALRLEKKNISQSWNSINDTASTYICVARSLYTSDEDITALSQMARNGNTVFIASSMLEDNFSNEFNCRITAGLTMSMIMGKPYEYTGVKLNEPYFTDTGSYRYYYSAFSRYFSAIDSSNTRVLGVNENGEPNFIVIFKGKGKIYVHCEPRVFSNYFLLQKENYRYLQAIFGYTRPEPEHVYWNDHYLRLRSRSDVNRNNDDSFSTLSEILKHPPLAAAFWLALVLLLLYVGYGIKRRQRIIEEIKPNENTTVKFTETIGRLYLQKKDNKNISEKMIAYFNEYIRNNYFLNTHAVNSDFITTLSRKSGMPRDKVESLYRAIASLQNSIEVDDFQLLSLNEQIQQFHKTTR